MTPRLKTKHLLTGLALACGIGLASAAHAEFVDFNASPVNTLSSGTYHVTVTETAPGSGVWNVTVTGNNDGRTVSNSSTAPVKSPSELISLNFFSTAGHEEATAGSGGTNSGGSFVGAVWDPTVAATGSTSTISYKAPVDKVNWLAPFGDNTFSGTLTLQTTDPITLITASLQDGGQQWFGSEAVQVPTTIPEPSAAALLLPALAPLGLALRRRRAA